MGLERKLFKNLMRGSGTSMFFFTGIDNETLIEVSKNVKKYLGYRRDELIGMSIRGLWKHQDERDILIERLNKKEKIENYQTSLIRKDGSEFIIKFDISKMHNGGTIGIAKDITHELKQKNDLVMALYINYEMIDTDLSTHIGKVEYYTKIFLNFLNLPNSLKEDIIMGAKLHDIGKIRLDKEGIEKLKSKSSFLKNGIITRFSDKNNPLNRHTDLGYTLLKDFSIFSDNNTILDITKYHHERYDGLGYYGLIGENIPYPARIMAIADAYDPMRNGRRYKKELKRDKIIREFRKCEGKQFDPMLTEMFIKAIREEDL